MDVPNTWCVKRAFVRLLACLLTQEPATEGQPSSGPACGVGGEGRTWQTQWDGKGRYPRGPELRTEGKGLEVVQSPGRQNLRLVQGLCES